MRGYLPTGWYPTAVAGLARRQASLRDERQGQPDAQPQRRARRGSEGPPRHLYPLDHRGHRLEGGPTRRPDEARGDDGPGLCERGARGRPHGRIKRAYRNPGIRHAIYIVKENRTYDNVFGDLPQGNGDASLTLFGREVTPNQHALAERFGLLDNFHVCAEVSADGWNWSTSGMANEHTARNVPYNYSGRGRQYDYEGENNGVAVDLVGLPDVAESAGGYPVGRRPEGGRSLRNYGMFVGEVEALGVKEGAKEEAVNNPKKRALQGVTDVSFPAVRPELPRLRGLPEARLPAPAHDRELREVRLAEPLLGVEARVRRLCEERKAPGPDAPAPAPRPHLGGPPPVARRRARWSPTTTTRWVRSWTRSRTRRSGARQ